MPFLKSPAGAPYDYAPAGGLGHHDRPGQSTRPPSETSHTPSGILIRRKRWRIAMRRVLLSLVLFLAACSTDSGIVEVTEAVGSDAVADGIADIPAAPDLTQKETTTPDIIEFDFSIPDIEEDLVPLCEGGGCFLDPCAENRDCQSAWCVEHLGDGVCTQACQEDCPPGWLCKQVGASDPDLVFICVSNHANLCKPCNSAADCKTVGGIDDVCVDYGDEGAFCGGVCAADEESPCYSSCGRGWCLDHCRGC